MTAFTVGEMEALRAERDAARAEAETLRGAGQAVVDMYRACRERNSMAGFWSVLDDLAAVLDGRAALASSTAPAREPLSVDGVPLLTGDAKAHVEWALRCCHRECTGHRDAGECLNLISSCLTAALIGAPAPARETAPEQKDPNHEATKEECP